MVLHPLTDCCLDILISHAARKYVTNRIWQENKDRIEDTVRESTSGCSDVPIILIVVWMYMYYTSYIDSNWLAIGWTFVAPYKSYKLSSRMKYSMAGNRSLILHRGLS